MCCIGFRGYTLKRFRQERIMIVYITRWLIVIECASKEYISVFVQIHAF